MNSPNTSIADFWARRPLPILESSKQELLQLARKADRLRSADLSSRVLQDPLLTAQALRYINQRPRTGLSTEVVSIDSVILLMGVNAFVEQFLRLPTVESMLLPTHPQAYLQLQRELQQRRLASRLAREFGVQRYDAHLDELYIAGEVAGLERCLATLAPAVPGAPAVVSPEDGIRLRANWKLPESICLLLNHQADISPRALLTQTAVTLAERMQAGWWQPATQDALHTAAAALASDQQSLWQSVTRLLLQGARRELAQPQVWPAARWLAMLPGDWPEPAKPAPVAHTLSNDRLKQLAAVVQNSAKAGASFNQIMMQAVTACTDGIGLNRVVFWLLMAGQNQLKVRYSVGLAGDDPLHELRIDLEAPHMFTQMMLKPQGVHLTAGNAKQLESLLPRGLRQVTGHGEFCAMSLFVGDKPVGLLYADRHGSAEAQVSEAQYQAFKQLCTFTGKCLTQKASVAR